MRTIITLAVTLFVCTFNYAQNDKSHEATHTVQQQKSEREKGSGLATGKRQHKPFVNGKKDHSSGKPTGRRQHGATKQQDDPILRKRPGRTKATDAGVGQGAKKGSGRATDYNSSRSNKHTNNK